MRHQRVSRPVAVRAWIWTSIQLPVGVSADHDGMSCENGKRTDCHGEVHVPVVPPISTIPSAGGGAKATLMNSPGAHPGDVSSIGAGTRELTRPVGSEPSKFRTVTCQ